jgi:hypothetical protein
LLRIQSLQKLSFRPDCHSLLLSFFFSLKIRSADVETIDLQMFDFRCPRAAWRFWTVVLFPALTSSETEVRNGIRRHVSSSDHTYLHQLNATKVLVVFNSATREDLQSQI